MKTDVITVGKELLIGRSINTNLAIIAKALLTIGIDIHRSYVIDDDKLEYKWVLDQSNADLIIFTGGLGPTMDDMTKEAVFDYFDVETTLNQSILDTIKSYFNHVDKPMTDANIKQAYFPKDSTILHNKLGTAPGVYFKVNDKRIILFPGPPHEMRPMLDTVVLLLKEELQIDYYTKGCKLVGVGESTLEVDMLKYYDMDPHVRVNPYAGIGEIKYILSSQNRKALDKVYQAFKQEFKDYIYGDLDDTLEGVLIKILNTQNKTISLAESCTGGMLASRIVNVSGASTVFKESFVTYSNTAKMTYLKVSKETLKAYGAVSEQCAKEMVEGLINETKQDVGIAITGIAGPTGGTKEKPVGLVHFGMMIDGELSLEKHIFNGNREMIRYRATNYALNMLRKGLIQ